MTVGVLAASALDFKAQMIRSAPETRKSTSVMTYVRKILSLMSTEVAILLTGKVVFSD